MRYELIVIGAGPAGLSAAIEAAKKGVKTVVFDENARPGGQLFKQIHKFFGSKEHKAKIRGFNIGKELLEEADKLGVEVVLNAAVMGLYPEKEVTVLYPWWHFLQIINTKIYHLTDSEDKELGYFFAKAKDDVISYDTFVSKVCFYLWNDIFKTYALDEQQGDLFSYTDEEGQKQQLTFPAFYDGDGNVIKKVAEAFINNVMNWNNDSKSDKA